MLKNYLKIAWRNLSKNKSYTIINVGGLALGMAVTLIIGLWIHDELSHDDYFENKNRIAQVIQSQTFNNRTGTGPAIPRPLEKALREGYGDNFEHLIMSSWTQQLYLKYKENSLARRGNYMQRDAPDLLSLQIINGEKDGLREVNSIMLSEKTANAFFGQEDPIGKTVKVDNAHDLMVTAVFKNLPFNSSFRDTEYIIPWDFYVSNREWVKNAEDNWGNNSFQLFVQLAENADMTNVSETIRNVKKDLNEDTAEFNPQLFLLPMKRLVFTFQF